MISSAAIRLLGAPAYRQHKHNTGADMECANLESKVYKVLHLHENCKKIEAYPRACSVAGCAAKRKILYMAR